MQQLLPYPMFFKRKGSRTSPGGEEVSKESLRIGDETKNTAGKKQMVVLIIPHDTGSSDNNTGRSNSENQEEEEETKRIAGVNKGNVKKKRGKVDMENGKRAFKPYASCLLYTSPSPRDS